VGGAALPLERFFLLVEQAEKYVQKAMQAVEGSLFSGIHPRCLNLDEFRALLNTEKV
jgi:hypothetical protein